MKMYIYFDRNGTIKEVINDESIRRGSSDYNKIYCYLEGNPDIDDIWYLQKNPDGTLTNEVSFVDNIVTKAIPYDAKRDMKYFQDFEEYQFYVFTLSSSYLSQNGLVVATIRVAENNTLWALGELTFNVQANIVNSDNDITQSQYDYLLLTISSYYSKTEIDNKLDLKADKSDTYTKQEVDEKDLNLAGQIASKELELNNRINTTNTQLEITNDKVTTLQNNTYSKTEVDEKIDDISAYTKSEIDTMINAKADKSDTYTKQEVNEEATSIYTYIDQVDTSLNTRVSRLDDRTLVLERDFEYLKSVQNVVDVVATKSDLNSYDPTYLGIDDKVQVIADESHDGASTIYNWDGTQWQYVGAFGGNSYTKAETYNKTQIDSALRDKADKSNTYTRAVIDSMILTLSTDKADKSTTYTKTEIDGKLEEIGPMFEIVEKELEKKSTVVANPTLSGNEATLDGLEVDGTKYKVGGGSAIVTLDDIVDSRGNKRFIEGNGTPATVTGFTPTYCKWSLSGTHLMCVLAGSLKNTTAFPANTSIVTFELPEYILNKIYPVWDNNIAFVDINTIYGGGTTLTYKVLLKKNNNSIYLENFSSISIVNDSNFRVRIDLLIDAS